MNAITTQSQAALVAHSPAHNPFLAAASDIGVIDGKFLRFDGNSGDFTVGSKDDGEELPHGTLLAADMMGIHRGWICWKDGDVVDEIMTSVLDGNPQAESSLPDHGPYETYEDGSEDGWSQQIKIDFYNTDTGETLVFKTSSASGLRAVGALLQAFGKLFKLHPGETPVIEIGANSFTPKTKKKIGKKYAPVLKLVDWMTQDEVENLRAGAASPPSDAAETDAKTGEDDPSNYEGGSEASTTVQTDEAKETAAQPVDAKPAEELPVTGRRAKRF